MADNARIATISALAAVAGALAGSVGGGLVTNAGQRNLQQDQADRADASELKVVRGDARFLIKELLDAGTWMSVARQQRKYGPLDATYRVQTPLADQKLIASRLNAFDWDNVQGALVRAGIRDDH